ncbi:MIS12 [Mytilus edulis]|uniref:Protein MIS12 homolog n=1 Tax=Mytilus edulis TaxID=6550 RepID=A0A8S3T316_MYTED|nr:MIS12 [Mytilus edulis]
MSEERNRKRSLSCQDDKETRKRRSICEDNQEERIPAITVTSPSFLEDAHRNSNIATTDELLVKETIEKIKNIEMHENKNKNLSNCDKHTFKSPENVSKSCDSVSASISTNDPQNSSVENPATKFVSTEVNRIKGHKTMASVSDSVFSEGSVLRSVSECDRDDSDEDPLEEYETQYFGFTPKSFMNGVYNALAEYIRESLAALAEYIKSQYPNGMTSTQLQGGEENMMKYILRKLNRSFDILEQYLMTNVFKIPDHVVLPEDQAQAGNQYTEEDEKQIDLEIKQLEDKLLTIRYANGILRQDLSEMDQVQSIFDKSFKQLETIEDMTSQCGISDIKDDTLKAISQVKKMISIVQTLELAKTET